MADSKSQSIFDDDVSMPAVKQENSILASDVKQWFLAIRFVTRTQPLPDRTLMYATDVVFTPDGTEVARDSLFTSTLVNTQICRLPFVTKTLIGANSKKPIEFPSLSFVSRLCRYAHVEAMFLIASPSVEIGDNLVVISAASTTENNKLGTGDFTVGPFQFISKRWKTVRATNEEAQGLVITLKNNATAEEVAAVKEYIIKTHRHHEIEFTVRCRTH
jgi:hypothetical protein